MLFHLTTIKGLSHHGQFLVNARKLPDFCPTLFLYIYLLSWLSVILIRGIYK